MIMWSCRYITSKTLAVVNVMVGQFVRVDNNERKL